MAKKEMSDIWKAERHKRKQKVRKLQGKKPK
jgi:hypothetical protein